MDKVRSFGIPRLFDSVSQAATSDDLWLRPFNDKEVELFERFRLILEHWSKAFNLTAIHNPEDFWETHICDSLAVLPLLRGNERILDVGTGGGFPGLPLKMLLPELEIDLLDGRGKKIEFVKEIIRSFNLQGARGLHSRLENFENDKKYDLIVSRATFPESDWILSIEHLIDADGGALLWRREGALKKEKNAFGISSCCYKLPHRGYRFIEVWSKVGIDNG